jgi:hypothetical protein
VKFGEATISAVERDNSIPQNLVILEETNWRASMCVHFVSLHHFSSMLMAFFNFNDGLFLPFARWLGFG